MFQLYRFLKEDSKNIFNFFLAKIDNFIDSQLNYRVFFFSEFQILVFLGFFKIENKKKTNFEVTSNIKYVLKTGNPKERQDNIQFEEKTSPGQN